jgi:hypothetical protein
MKLLLSTVLMLVFTVVAAAQAPVKLAISKKKQNVVMMAMTNKKREVRFLVPRNGPNPKMFVILGTKASEMALTTSPSGEYVFGFLIQPVLNGKDLTVFEVRALLQPFRGVTSAKETLALRYESAGLYALGVNEKVVLNNVKRYGVKPFTLERIEKAPALKF